MSALLPSYPRHPFAKFQRIASAFPLLAHIRVRDMLFPARNGMSDADKVGLQVRRSGLSGAAPPRGGNKQKYLKMERKSAQEMHNGRADGAERGLARVNRFGNVAPYSGAFFWLPFASVAGRHCAGVGGRVVRTLGGLRGNYRMARSWANIFLYSSSAHRRCDGGILGSSSHWDSLCDRPSL